MTVSWLVAGTSLSPGAASQRLPHGHIDEGGKDPAVYRARLVEVFVGRVQFQPGPPVLGRLVPNGHDGHESRVAGVCHHHAFPGARPDPHESVRSAQRT